jgi:ElaB/YqjD/DUF883 family membrane-anchored ribosome-binding protein
MNALTHAPSKLIENHGPWRSHLKVKKELNIMDNQPKANSDDMNALADDARALMAATADVAGEKIGAARKRLASALERTKEVASRVREKAVESAKAADQALHEHPYQAIGIAFGVGALLGYLIARQCPRQRD